MINRGFRVWAAAALLCLVGSFAQAFQLDTAATNAEWVVPAGPVRHYVEVAFRAELTRVEETDGDLSVSWGNVGGIDPTPFRLIVPAECMVRDSGFTRVRSYRA